MAEGLSPQRTYKLQVHVLRAYLKSAINIFEVLSDHAGNALLMFSKPLNDIRRHRDETSRMLEDTFGQDKANSFRDLIPLASLEKLSRKNLVEICDRCRDYLIGVLEEFDRNPSNFIEKPEKSTPQELRAAAGLEKVTLLCKRFPQVVATLRIRRKGNDPVLVEDEHTVQCVFGALLRIFFDDIRPEEPTPAFAAGSGKLDFLFKPERIGLETKMTREGLDAVELRKQVLDDIGLYSDHPNFDTLVFFVYDPARFVNNTAGFVADIESHPAKKRIKVFIER